MLRRCFRWKRAHAGVSEPPSGGRRPRRGILFILGCSLAVTAGSLWTADPDVFWHLKVGEWIVANLAVPRLDIYSWSVQGQPWTAHQWLWEALMYLMHSFAGIHGLWFLAFASALTAGLLLRGALKERGVPEEKASAAGGIAPLMLVGWLKPWPQAGVYALFAAYLFLSLRRKWGARELLFTAALGLVWSNIHSTAVLFPLLLLAESLWALIFQKDREAKKEALRSRLAAFVVAAAATLLNPHGFGLWIYAVREGLLTGNYRENIYSWMPYVFGPNVLALAFFISIIILFMAVRQGREKELAFARAAGFWVLALFSRIYTPYAVLSPAALLGLLHFHLEAGSLRRLAAVSLAAAIVVPAIAGLPPDLETVARKGGYPVEAAAFISRQGLARVFNDHGWGGYLIWKEIPVFIDGRNDVYGPVLEDFINLHKTDRPLGEAVAETGAGTVLTRARETRDLSLRESALWQEVYRDEDAVVYVKK